MVLLTLAAPPASAANLSGPWLASFGRLDVVQTSDRVVAAAHGAAACSPPASGHLLEGDLLEDSLSGQLFVCLSGCNRPAGWVPVLLLVAPDGKSLSGTSTLPKGCGAPLGPHGSLVLRRAEVGLASDSAGSPGRVVGVGPEPPPFSPRPQLSGKPPSPGSEARAESPTPSRARSPASGPAASSAPAPEPAAGQESAAATVLRRPVESPAAREKALELARDGLSFQQEGKFEQARRRFQQAIELDPLYAEGFNGVGVTFFARNDYPEALRWYKRALGADPDFGDAYYNMACVYALQGRNALALRYLRTAFHNGYTSRQTLRDDPDLAGLHGDPAFRALLQEPQ